jgi:L-arabinose isomerase
MERIIHKSEFDDIPEHIKKLSKTEIETTEKVFRTAYCIAKNQRPFSVHLKLIDLQICNGLNMRRLLQSDKSCSNIVYHIAIKMRKKVCSNVIIMLLYSNIMLFTNKESCA